MRAVVQRCSSASVEVSGQIVGRCGQGVVVLVGAGQNDTESTAKKMADRVWGMRIFPDGEGKMNLNLAKYLLDKKSDVHANVLVVSNFTLYGDTSQRRLSFSGAAPYADGERLYDRFVNELRSLGAIVETGVYGADMQVDMVNDGPVTLIIEI